MVTSKAALRRRMLAIRASVTDRAGKSDAIVQRLLEPRDRLGDACGAVVVGKVSPGEWIPCLGPWLQCFTFIYVSYGEEVQTHGLIKVLLDRAMPVAVPCVTGEGAMFAQAILSFEELRPGRYGILSPPPDGVEVEPEVCVMPCLAVTRSGVRLGMGGGYYDRYLAARPDMSKIVLAFDEQVIDAIPTEPHDRRVDWIMTPTRTIRCA